MSVELTVDERGDRLDVQWRTRRASGSATFDRLPGTVPEWLAAADDLFEGAGRREEGWIADAVAAWAAGAHTVVGVWHDGDGIEILGRD